MKKSTNIKGHPSGIRMTPGACRKEYCNKCGQFVLNLKTHQEREAGR